jgi:hypothetical protein
MKNGRDAAKDGGYHDKRIELPITGLLPLNRRKNAAAWKAQGIDSPVFCGSARKKCAPNTNERRPIAAFFGTMGRFGCYL